jgi:hypothetical protein
MSGTDAEPTTAQEELAKQGESLRWRFEQLALPHLGYLYNLAVPGAVSPSPERAGWIRRMRSTPRA